MNTQRSRIADYPPGVIEAWANAILNKGIVLPRTLS